MNSNGVNHITSRGNEKKPSSRVTRTGPTFWNTLQHVNKCLTLAWLVMTPERRPVYSFRNGLLFVSIE